MSARSVAGATAPWKEMTVDGVRLAYDDEGRGRALVCLHSIGHGARDYEALRARLRGHCRVLALDWPGHGSSGQDHLPTDATRYADLLAGFVQALGLDDYVLLGNSIGGAAALRCAARRPRGLRGVVIVDSGGLDQGGWLGRVVPRAMARFFAAGARGARWYPRAFAAYYRLVLTEAPARAQRERIVAGCALTAPRLTEAWQSFARPDADVRAEAASLACPVLACWATGDRISQLRRNRAAIERIPDARLELFPGGHSPFLECPDLFVPVLERFLDELPTGCDTDRNARDTGRSASEVA